MAWWLLKTEPLEYSLADLQRAGTDVWNGVRNPVALQLLRNMQPGDAAFIYHTGKERAIVGVATVASLPYNDPVEVGKDLPVVNVTFQRQLPIPVTLAQVKADPDFEGWHLVRLPRLSVMPVPDHLVPKLLSIAGEMALV
jgi:predicted RNA-binding protein with PUA-like domain